MSMLGLIGIEADPLASREFVLLANLVENAWRAGRDLDLATLIGEIQTPPLRKLGVFDVDTFFPAKDRTRWRCGSNGLVASPSFAAWSAGAPLDIGAMLARRRARRSSTSRTCPTRSASSRSRSCCPSSSPGCAAQPGTTDLRALVYMDEVFGFAPPTATPPAKKPILTILKQGRAFGVGMVLSTQNPVDLDYKAMANAGTWMVGRLQTENDKARVLEGLKSAAGGTDMAALDAAIGGLAKRQFMLVSAKSNHAASCSGRASAVVPERPADARQVAADERASAGRRRCAAGRASGARRAAPATPAAPLAADETPVAPPVAAGVAVAYLDPAAPWARRPPAGGALHAYLAARVQRSLRRREGRIDERDEFEALYGPLDDGPRPRARDRGRLRRPRLPRRRAPPAPLRAARAPDRRARVLPRRRARIARRVAHAAGARTAPQREAQARLPPGRDRPSRSPRAATRPPRPPPTPRRRSSATGSRRARTGSRRRWPRRSAGSRS